MLVVETIARIRRDHLVKGVPIKKLARDLRVSKNTIRKVVRGDATSHTYERKIQPMPKLGPWVDELERQLEANEKKKRRCCISVYFVLVVPHFSGTIRPGNRIYSRHCMRAFSSQVVASPAFWDRHRRPEHGRNARNFSIRCTAESESCR